MILDTILSTALALAISSWSGHVTEHPEHNFKSGKSFLSLFTQRDFRYTFSLLLQRWAVSGWPGHVTGCPHLEFRWPGRIYGLNPVLIDGECHRM